MTCGSAVGAAPRIGMAWQRYTADYGLASNTVRSVWSNAPGSVWFGTNAGLSHLDQASSEWQTLTIINSDLPGSTVTALWGDGQAL